jgi:hypothetical protein
MGIKIKYDTPMEVSETHFRVLVRELPGVICHKEKDGKFYIKVWLMEYTKEIRKILNS